ncbi:MAG: hypothetical protein A4E55_01828 [Pelotomaculum sp. PtaU1.Bin035]|nr:MAG: hypothetical protein A4E55_01828 [Pelotomaculum sp. PtaU1.Bin035]
MIAGRSYYHQEQPPGRLFKPGYIYGYFNDLTAKTRWKGPVTESGCPLNQRDDGKFVLIPTTIAQKALGHYDIWLLNRDRRSLDEFMILARWMRNYQDVQGGWPIWPALGLNCISDYSAMVQGEAISVFVRAYQLESDPSWIKAAEAAARLMLKPVKKGGTSRYTPEGLVLEEFPLECPSTIFNGWFFALFGLYDLMLAKFDFVSEMDKVLEETLRALIAYLPRYDAGYWSYYDTGYNLASPFYHKLHIAQLYALEITFPSVEAVAGLYRARFERQWSKRTNRLRAVVKKGLQKLMRPPDVILR